MKPRWHFFPSGLILTTACCGWIVLEQQQGLARVYAWFSLLLGLPGLGLITLVAISIDMVARRKFSRASLLSQVIALTALLPIIQVIHPVMAFPATIQTTSPSATVRLPANVKLKVLWGGDDLVRNYHAVTPDQRWAYDLVVAPYLVGSRQLRDYGCYGVPVVAPIEGIIVDAHDGEPDELPGMLPNKVYQPEGNHIILRLADGTYLIIAHLMAGSLRVERDQWVKEGSLIAQCGNSGMSSEPHIHIHHQRQNPLDVPQNFAEGLPLYFRDHFGDPMPVGGINLDDGKPIAVGVVVQHRGHE